MIRPALQHARVHIGPSPARKALKKVVDEFRLQITDQTVTDLSIHDRNSPAAKIDGSQTQSLVHRHNEVPSPQNPQLLPQRLVESLTQGNPNIFHRVMLVHIQIALSQQPQIKPAVPRKQFQHMIKEPYTSGNLILSPTINVQREVDLRLVRIPLDASLPHATTSGAILSSAKTLRSAVSNCSVCVSDPWVIRTHP